MYFIQLWVWVYVKDSIKDTPLSYACLIGNKGMIQTLIENDIEINKENEKKENGTELYKEDDEGEEG
ncbi:hypothetical protein PIROE2DRAFT_11941 [Piromyces sp. E2]|nr:hypothetical protein PIROE2DRAFT_11941 [Piromyces sp. E2]|eukprot:OUM61925.1 hypothetical protein PIROE2DRAFT_11941 [Piromyces sp. E2]